MAKKFADVNDKIAQTVVAGYKKIENGVVDGYQKIENSIVGGFNQMNDAIIAAVFAKEGETVEQAKARLAGNAAVGGENQWREKA